ncbi:MAG: hypothetical protein ACK4RM_09385 [Flavobacterium sp.]
MSLPSLIVMIDKNTNISFVLSSAEEEETIKTISETILLSKHIKFDFTLLPGPELKNFNFDYSENLNLLFELDIIIPPPKVI